MRSERMGTALDSSTTDKVATEFKEGGADILHTEEYVVRLRSTGVRDKGGYDQLGHSLSFGGGKLDLANLIKDKWPNKRTTLRYKKSENIGINWVTIQRKLKNS